MALTTAACGFACLLTAAAAAGIWNVPFEGEFVEVPPAQAPVLNIDIYRALNAAGEEYETLDDDVADIGGVLKYVHTEILTEHLLDPLRTARKYHIDTVRRQRYKIRNPAESMKGSPFMDFQLFITYDSGVATNKHQWELLQECGDFVGMQQGCPLGHCDPRYPAESPYLWFSVGNFCPNLRWEHKGTRDSPNPQCMKSYQGGFVDGGLCPNGRDTVNVIPAVEPTGQRGCVYSYGTSQLVKLDEVVGINLEDCGGRTCADWLDFRHHCTDPALRRQFASSGHIKDVHYCVEYDIHPHCEANCGNDACQALLRSGQVVELGLAFWRGRCTAAANQRRTEHIAGSFGIGEALARHQTVSQDVLSLDVPCVRPDSAHCRPGSPAVGGPYCTRAISGVCEMCFVPGTTQGSDHRHAAFCPLNLFEMSDYSSQDAFQARAFPVPACKSNRASDLCCLYLNDCEGDSDPARAPLDDDGFALVAARKSTLDMFVFLQRALPGASAELLRRGAYHQWDFRPIGKPYQQALADVLAFMQEPLAPPVASIAASAPEPPAAATPPKPLVQATPAPWPRWPTPVPAPAPAVEALTDVEAPRSEELTCLEWGATYAPSMAKKYFNKEAIPHTRQAVAACQQLCQGQAGCAHFVMDLQSRLCQLVDASAERTYPAWQMVAGPPLCRREAGLQEETTFVFRKFLAVPGGIVVRKVQDLQSGVMRGDPGVLAIVCGTLFVAVFTVFLAAVTRFYRAATLQQMGRSDDPYSPLFSRDNEEVYSNYTPGTPSSDCRSLPPSENSSGV